MVDILKTEPVYFGRQGENIAREVIFDITSLKREFPDAVYSLVLQRVGDLNTFTAVATTINGNEFRYMPTSWATAVEGTGQWEIHAVDANTGLIAKTVTGTFIVDDALDEAINAAPEVAENWIQEVTRARDEAVAAAQLATESVSIDVSQMQQDIANKLDKATNNGANGQLATSDGAGGWSWEDPPETYTLPAATTTRLGGVIIGDGLSLDGDGKLTAQTAELATENRDGLLRATDQRKLNTIEENANYYVLPKATRDSVGGMQVGNNLSVDENGVVSVDMQNATRARTGLVMVGDNLTIDGNGKLDVVVPKASANELGGIKVGRNLTIEQDGTLNSQDSYVLPTATGSRLGGVKIGDNLTMDENGVLSADAQPIQPATDVDLGGIKIGNGLSINELGVASAYSYDITKTSPDNGRTYQLNLIRSDGDEEEIVQTIDLPSGGGGGGGNSLEGFYLNIDRVTTSPIIATTQDTVNITVDIQSREGSDVNAPFIDGTYAWRIGSTLLAGMSGAYSRVRNTFNLTPYLTQGTHRVSLTVTQADSGLTQTRSWTVQVVDIRLDSAFMDEYTNPAGEDINFTYIPYGAVPKEVHFKLDGTELETTSLGAGVSGTTQMKTIPAHAHGTHTLEVWMVATVGVNEKESNHLYKDLIWYDEDSHVPIISCAQKVVQVPANAEFDENQTYYAKVEGLYEVSPITAGEWVNHDTLYYMDHKAKQYSSTVIRFNVYDPNTPTPTVVLYEDGVEISRRTLTESVNNTWTYASNTAGLHTLTIGCLVDPGNDEPVYVGASVDIIMDIEALEVTINPVTDNLVFDFNPIGHSNTDQVRLWSYTNAQNDTYSMTVVSSDFDWVNGGYQLDENNDMSFLIKAGNRVEIDRKLFERDQVLTKRNGQHFKIVFRTENVRNASATWLSCMGENGAAEIGLEMKVHEAYLYSGNNNPESDNPTSMWSPYSENDRIEYEFDIHPIDTNDNSASSYFMSYEDGTMFRPIIYENGNILRQLPASPITIGSDDCDVRIYRIKEYSASLSDMNVIDNFIADASSGEEMYARYLRNQIFDQDQRLTPEFLASACPDLRIIKISAPHFTNDKDNKVNDTTVECIYQGGDPVLDNWTVTNASHSAQGTTSNRYGISGRNIDLRLNTDTAVCTFKDGTSSEPGEVSISLSRDSIPTNYFNIKVNIASSENANNALLAKRYDRYLPYDTPARKRDPRAKTTMEFFNCVVFIQETGDSSIHEEFADTDWHFYGIGNIGDSKKTDKTRAYTPGDPKEFVNEILDNTLVNSRFDTGVYNMLVGDLPVSGELLVDYYTQNQDGTYTLHRYLNSAWVTVNESMTEITNGAVAVLNTRPSTGVYGIEYYIVNDDVYDMYIWKNNAWSIATTHTASDLNDALRRHMATAIDPLQWVVGNEKYDAMMADPFDKSATWEMRWEGGTTTAQHEENIAVWQQMYTWMVVSSDDNFREHLGDWFIVDAALYSYLFTEWYTMMDNRAKNTFWHYAKFYVSEAEYASSDICYTALGENDIYDERITYYEKDNGAYVVWNGQWNERPQLYVHNNYYTVDNDAAAIRNGYRFDFWDYDNDSALGIDNTGAMGLSYGKEDIDQTVENDPTSTNVYNAADSVFWRRIRLLFRNELVQMYQTLEDNGCWTATGFISEFDNWQAQWPEALWSKDMERKYIRPYFGTSYDNSTTAFSNGSVKRDSMYITSMLNGRKKYQRRQWINDQWIYMGTKYLAASVTGNDIMIRCYQPVGAVVPPDYTLHIVPYSDMYLSVMFGSGDDKKSTQVRAKAGTEYSIPCPIPMENATDIPFYIYAASHIQELSDLSACYFKTNRFGNAVRLKTLKVGNSTEGYSNQIQVLNIGTGRHDLLEKLDVTNCTQLVGTSDSGTMNLSGCGRLKEFYAGGTSISSVIFATNGKLEKAVLPDTLTGLTAIGLDHIIEFTANYDHLISLTLEGGVLDSRAIIGDAYDTIRSLRLTDINWRGEKSLPSSEILNMLTDTLNRMYDTYITGYVYIAGPVTQREMNHYASIVPFLEVGYELMLNEYTVRYVNIDDTLLGYEYVTAGTTLTNPIGRTIIGPNGTNIIFGTPSMSPSEQYIYEFSGWNTLEGNVNGDKTVMATYNTQIRTYTVNWYGKINGLKLASGEYEYGEEAVYDYTPTLDVVQNENKTYYYRAEDGSFIPYVEAWEERPKLYTHNDIPIDTITESMEIFKLFSGWDKNTGYVRPDTSNPDGHVDVYAIWQECNGMPALNTDLSTLNAAAVYAITRQPSATIKQYFSMDAPDYVTLTLGHDMDFSNVDSYTIVNSKRWFDGTYGEIVTDGNNQPICLFAEDAPSFTLAIDFEMRNCGVNDNEKTLVGCYHGDGRLGFRLKCGYRESDESYRPIIEWGNQIFEVSYSYEYGENETYYDNRYRDMVVLRHIAGDPRLYVYTSNVGAYFNLNGITRYMKSRSTYMPTDAPLVLGGMYIDTDGEFNNNQYGTGYIYWCKIWYDDLGEYNCRQLASWPREQINMEYYGTKRYYLTEGGRSAASFISRKPLYGRTVQAPASTHENAVWSNSPVRTFLKMRIEEALPIEWQSVLRTTRVNTIPNSGSQTQDVEVTDDKLFLPAYAEVFAITSTPYIFEQFSNSELEGTMISWFATTANRVKSKVLDIRPNPTIWTGTSDPTTQIGNAVRFGDIWVQAATGAYPAYLFVDKQTIEREHLAVRSGTIMTETGGWVSCGSMWGLRTPYSGLLADGLQYQYHAVSANGGIATSGYAAQTDYGAGVAIDFCFSV